MARDGDGTINGHTPDHFGIHKSAIGAWNRLSEAIDEVKFYPCNDNPYYYMDYDGYGIENDSDVYWQKKSLSEDDCEALCTDCPLIKLCYDFAVANDEKYGVWGGINFGAEDNKKDGKLF